MMLDLALNDDNDEVRYEAMLQYRSHPQAEVQHYHRYMYHYKSF